MGISTPEELKWVAAERLVQGVCMGSAFVWAVWMIKVFVLKGAQVCVTFPP